MEQTAALQPLDMVSSFFLDFLLGDLSGPM